MAQNLPYEHTVVAYGTATEWRTSLRKLNMASTRSTIHWYKCCRDKSDVATTETQIAGDSTTIPPHSDAGAPGTDRLLVPLGHQSQTIDNFIYIDEKRAGRVKNKAS